MDSKSFNYLNELAIDNISLIKYDEMEDCFPKLKDARKNRSKVEYFFTCSPAVCKMVIEKNSKIEFIKIFMEMKLPSIGFFFLSKQR